MAQLPTPTTHPLLACADQVLGAIDEVRHANPTLMDTDQKEAALIRLTRADEQLRALKLKVLASADDVAEHTGARDAAAWLTHRCHGRRGTDRHALALAQALDRRWHRVADAFLGGALNQAQADVIVHALDALPTRLGPDLAGKAETRLVELAAHHGPADLKRLGRHILDVVAPDIAEEEDRRRLEAEERAARRRTSLEFRTRPDGTTDITIRLPHHTADRLKIYLESFTSPRHHATTPATEAETDSAVEGAVAPGEVDREVERLPHHRRLGEAFCALLERLPSQVLPQHGGTATTVVVTIDHDQLRSGLGHATLDTGTEISIGEARRLACNAGILPAVLDGDSVPLDLGRTKRLYDHNQRIALAIRDHGCKAEGCDIPAAWCEAHHATLPWLHGGLTNLADGLLLCPWHHHRAHDDHYHTHRLPNGDVRFRRRT